jgi:hypothetical protein
MSQYFSVCDHFFTMSPYALHMWPYSFHMQPIIFLMLQYNVCVFCVNAAVFFSLIQYAAHNMNLFPFFSFFLFFLFMQFSLAQYCNAFYSQCCNEQKHMKHDKSNSTILFFPLSQKTSSKTWSCHNRSKRDLQLPVLQQEHRKGTTTDL